jgi:hypothetical protein
LAKDAEGDTVSDSVAEANARTARLAANAPKLVLPGSEGSTPEDLKKETKTDPGEEGSTPAKQTRLVSLGDDGEEIVAKQAVDKEASEEDKDDPGRAWLGQYDGDQERANREALETQRRAKEAAEENKRLKAELEGLKGKKEPEKEAPALPESDEEVDALVGRYVAADAVCTDLSNKYSENHSKLLELVDLDESGKVILDRQGRPAGGQLRDALDDIAAVRKQLDRKDDLDEVQKESLKEQLSELKDKHAQLEQEFNKRWRSAVDLAKRHEERRKLYRERIVAQVKEAEASREREVAVARESDIWDQTFAELITDLPDGQDPKKLQTRLALEMGHLRNTSGKDWTDLASAMREVWQKSIEPDLKEIRGAQEARRAARKIETAKQPAPKGEQAIAAEPDLEKMTPRERRKLADLRTARLTRRVGMVTR